MLNMLAASTRLVVRVARGMTIMPTDLSVKLSSYEKSADPIRAQLAVPVDAKHRFRAAGNLIILGMRMGFGEKRVIQREEKVKVAAVIMQKKRILNFKKKSLGFDFKTNPDGNHTITMVDRATAAGSMHMTPGDIVAKVNGVAVSGMAHADVKRMLKSARKKVRRVFNDPRFCPVINISLCPVPSLILLPPRIECTLLLQLSYGMDSEVVLFNTYSLL
jgi:hypothetical protein